MRDVISQIISGVVVTIIISWLGLSKKHKQIIKIQNHQPSKKWKWFVIVGAAMFVAGLYAVVLNVRQGAFANLWFNIGFCSLFIGLILWIVGRFGVWYNR